MFNNLNNQSHATDNFNQLQWIDLYSELGINQYLNLFANSDVSWNQLNTVFGTNYNNNQAQIIRNQWQTQNFSSLPQIEVISSSILGDAKGAYAASTNKIYLSVEFLTTATLQSLSAVILEEIGHWLDAQINKDDSFGDEGEEFSALVRGENLSNQQLARIQTENDRAVVQIQGQAVEVENAAPIVLKVNTTADQNDGTTTNGLSLRDAILIANADTTNDYVIELQGGETYYLSIKNTNLIQTLRDEQKGFVGDLDILAGGNITIKSIGNQKAIINGSNLKTSFAQGFGDSIIHVQQNASLLLENVTLTGASASAIRINKNGEAEINNSLITGNSVTKASGGKDDLSKSGGISNYGLLRLNNSVVSNNTTETKGGGIYNAGKAKQKILALLAVKLILAQLSLTRLFLYLLFLCKMSLLLKG